MGETKRTLKNFIKTAFAPVGETLYIYGGGWNEEDNGAGIGSCTIGILPEWKCFFRDKDSSYNYKEYNTENDKTLLRKGLDCSGYVGWVLYNSINDGRGYVGKSYEMGRMLESMKVGKIVEDTSSTLAGDIMFGSTHKTAHVYISLGECKDGSRLLLHSSPPGVQLCGTVSSYEYGERSDAVKLAEKYMQKHFAEYYSKFPNCSRDVSYINSYCCFRLTIFSDNEGYRNMSPEDILEDLYP